MSEQQTPAAADTPNPTPNSPTDQAAAPAAPAAAGAEEPYFASWADDLKVSPVLGKYKSAEDVARALIAAENRLGTPADQLVRLPKAPDDKDGLAAVYKALGAPDAPEGYKIAVEGISDTDKAAVESFVRDMHAQGPFPPQFLAAATGWWAQEVARQDAEATQALANQRAAGEAELQQEWGGAYQQRTTEIGALIAELGGEALAKELNASNLGDSPALARLLSKVVEMRAEPGPVGDAQRAEMPGRSMTAQEGRAYQLRLEADQQKMAALMDGSHPQHAAVVEERNRYLAAQAPRTS